MARFLSPRETPFGGQLVTLVCSLTGTLCLGVGSLLSALESERDTLRVQADRLRSAQVERAEALRLQSLGRLASGVAHDFNNVLGLIGNGIHFVEESLRDEHSEVQRDLRNMRVAVDRGVGLTRRLISFSRAQVNTPECFAPAVVLRENIDMERSASVGRVTPGEWIRLSVIDDGIGIAPHILPNLFEPFFTTKGDAGTGLGLATVAAAVHDVHGAVDVYSTPGHGTRFDVWLPACMAQLSSEPSGETLQDESETEVQNAP